MIEELLRNKNIKITKQRKIILNIIVELLDNSTVKNISKNCENVDISTIYRTLEFLINKNILDKNINSKGEVYYLIREEHEDTFVCVKCKKQEKLNTCPININCVDNGKIINHSIKIEGICKNCMNKEN